MLFSFLIQEEQRTFAASSSPKAQWPFHWWQIPQHQSRQDQTETELSGLRKKIKTEALPNAASGAVPP